MAIGDSGVGFSGSFLVFMTDEQSEKETELRRRSARKFMESVKQKPGRCCASACAVDIVGVHWALCGLLRCPSCNSACRLSCFRRSFVSIKKTIFCFWTGAIPVDVRDFDC